MLYIFPIVGILQELIWYKINHHLFLFFSRIKRYYLLQDLAKLFDEKDFDSNEFILETLDEEKGHLPLFLFDNEDFETRTPSQW